MKEIGISTGQIGFLSTWSCTLAAVLNCVTPEHTTKIFIGRTAVDRTRRVGLPKRATR